MGNQIGRKMASVDFFLLSNGKSLSSGKIQEKVCQKIAKSRIQEDCPFVSTDVSPTPNLSSDTIVTSGEQKPDDYSDLTSLPIRALNKLANSQKYNGIVEDIHAFVNVFNERTPEYKIRFGQQAVLCNAEKQKARGWK
jgi:hypothetical protein